MKAITNANYKQQLSVSCGEGSERMTGRSSSSCKYSSLSFCPSYHSLPSLNLSFSVSVSGPATRACICLWCFANKKCFYDLASNLQVSHPRLHQRPCLCLRLPSPPLPLCSCHIRNGQVYGRLRLWHSIQRGVCLIFNSMQPPQEKQLIKMWHVATDALLPQHLASSAMS